MGRKKLVLILLAVLELVALMQLLIVEIFNPEKYTFFQIFIATLSGLATGVLLLFLLIIPFFDRTLRYQTKKRIIYLGLFGLLYVVVFILTAYLIPALFLWKSFTSYESAIINYAVSDFNNVLLSYLFQIAILYAYEYISNETLLISKQKNLEVELNQTKLQMLKSQLQPHFLFNSLNSVVAVIDENKKKAQSMLINISDILRTTLNTDFTKKTTLNEEIEYIKKYLSIEKMRYETQLEFAIEVSPEAGKMQIPALILQPLIENAIKHGFRNLNKELTVIIEAEVAQKTILVKNNGAPITSFEMQTGLTNVSERLLIFTNNKNAFRIYQEGDWVINEIDLA